MGLPCEHRCRAYLPLLLGESDRLDQRGFHVERNRLGASGQPAGDVMGEERVFGDRLGAPRFLQARDGHEAIVSLNANLVVLKCSRTILEPRNLLINSHFNQRRF